MSVVATNLIPDRIADALRRFPPFSMLPEETVTELAAEATVRVCVPGDLVWRHGDPPGDELFFLARGRVEYFGTTDGRPTLVDVRDVGDLLGLTALVSNQRLNIEARVVEESILYGLRWARLRKIITEHDDARNYVNRHLFWATRIGSDVEGMPSVAPSIASSEIGGRSKNILQAHLEAGRLLQPRGLDRLLTCAPTDSIVRAAELMSARRVPSVLVVDDQRRPLGIVTHSAIVKHVVAGEVNRNEPVSRIMASPVITVSANSSATAAILLMLRERIGQVCITEDGTPDTAALDVVTNKDLLAQSGHHPAGLLREFRHARTPARLRELCDEVEEIARSYLDAGVSAIFLGQICAELYDELLQRLLEMTTDELSAAGVALPRIRWAWLSVGSDGRREQILRTDMDNALVFAAAATPEEDERNRAAFLQLSQRVVALLVECGFARCQGGVMASNPRWCRTDAEWRTEIETIGSSGDPEQLFRGIVLYDLRYVAGDAAIAQPLRQAVFDSVRGNDRLQHRLAELVVETPPPLNFWGRFIVERKGDRAGEFDIKGRGLAPLRDAARLLALKHGLTRRYSTGGRWDDLARQVPRVSELARLAQEGYDELLRLRTATALRRGDSGRFVDPSALSKLDRSRLANVFDVVRMVQDHVKLEFRLENR
jgi:CBS domain-containing protein